MSWLKIGQIVMSLAGHDKGKFHIVTAVGDGKAAVADGKHRKLAQPKWKNCKHLQKTNEVIPVEGLTDRALRRLLSEKSGTGHRSPEKGEESACQKKM